MPSAARQHLDSEGHMQNAVATDAPPRPATAPPRHAARQAARLPASPRCEDGRRPLRAARAAAHRRRRRRRPGRPAPREAAPQHLPRPGQARGGQGAGQGRRRQRHRRATTSSSPRQERNLEKELGIPVVDRTATILDIFAAHAHTAEGKLQVELAQLEYNLARMRGLWTPPRAPGRRLQRRLRDPRPGRVADRDRPPPGARPHRRAAPPAGAASRARARRSAPSASARTCRRSRWPATRTRASRRCSTR